MHKYHITLLEEDYYEPIRISNDFDDNFIEYESHGNKNKTLSIEECLDKIIPYLINMINDLKTQIGWKIQLIMAINLEKSLHYNLLHYKCHKISLNCGGSYIDS